VQGSGPEHDRDEEVETQIMLLEVPFGDPPHLRARARASDWLMGHPERAYPRLLARLESGRATPALVELLARLGRAESIAPLERLLTGPTSTEPEAYQAGQALAMHPQPAAGEALRRALANGEPHLATIAADALATRGDRSDCAALSTHLTAPDGRLRYHVVQAADRLDCLARDDLEKLARSDSDSDVRDLARRLLTKH
jgi:HEAT repeat protein